MKYYQRLHFNEAGEAKYRTNNNFILALSNKQTIISFLPYQTNNNFILALPATHVSRQILTRYLYSCIFTFRAEFFCRIGRG